MQFDIEDYGTSEHGVTSASSNGQYTAVLLHRRLVLFTTEGKVCWLAHLGGAGHGYPVFLAGMVFVAIAYPPLIVAYNLETAERMALFSWHQRPHLDNPIFLSGTPTGQLLVSDMSGAYLVDAYSGRTLQVFAYGRGDYRVTAATMIADNLVRCVCACLCVSLWLSCVWFCGGLVVCVCMVVCGWVVVWVVVRGCLIVLLCGMSVRVSVTAS